MGALTVYNVGESNVLNRESQKQIVIGQRGEQIKAVGVRARDKIEKFLQEKVFLQLTGKLM